MTTFTLEQKIDISSQKPLEYQTYINDCLKIPIIKRALWYYSNISEFSFKYARTHVRNIEHDEPGRANNVPEQMQSIAFWYHPQSGRPIGFLRFRISYDFTRVLVFFDTDKYGNSGKNANEWFELEPNSTVLPDRLIEGVQVRLDVLSDRQL